MRIQYWAALVSGWIIAAMIGQTVLAADPADELSETATFPDSIDDSDLIGSVVDDPSDPSAFAPMQYADFGAYGNVGAGNAPPVGGYSEPTMPPSTAWPTTSPFSQHRMEQYSNNVGLWEYESDDRVNKKFFFNAEYLYAHGLRMGDRFIGDPNFRGTVVLPNTPVPAGVLLFPNFSTGQLGTNLNVFHNGFRPRWGYENPDGSGLVLSGFILFENDVNNRRRIFGQVLGNTQLLASIPVNNRGVGLGLPIDTRLYNQFTQEIMGADLDYYTMPFFTRPGFQLKMLYGAKYLRVSEQFLVDGLDSGLGYTITGNSGSSGGAATIGGFFPIRDPYSVVVASSTTSNLVGPILGVRYDVGGEKFKFWGQSKVGVMANMEKLNVASAGLNQIKFASPFPPDNTLIGGSGNGSGFSQTKFTQRSTHISPLFETSVNVEFPFFAIVPYVNRWHLFEHAKVRIGWNFVAVDAMSRAAQIISYNLDAAGIKANRTWFEYNAFNFGVDWKW